ncbi:MAG: 3'(2'),5'-bisphosphate nucleotidase CysQ [Alphaproteobacteria bacterium]|nr:3'(2'),5'-bisphosphate nucleotidase CysQ [Alphaproteobacteria bacterium]
MSFDDQIFSDRELIRSAVVAAGIIGSGYFRREVKSWSKANASPVSEADMAIDEYLRTVLLAARPDYGWLSEETPDNFDRLERHRLFVVDPIDGTRGYIRGDDSWCISVAVVEAGRPVTGVIYAPARDEMYDAVAGAGARLNGELLLRETRSLHTPPVIPTPGAVHKVLNAAGIAFERGAAVSSLAYRLMQLANGTLDAVVARRGAQDWDIAAAVLVLSEAGIRVSDVCRTEMVFNTAEVRHGALAATADPALFGPLSAALIDIYGCPQTGHAEQPAEIRQS